MPTTPGPTSSSPASGSAADSDAETPGPDRARVLVIGCGNLLRSDDGVGPVLLRHLLERGLPPGMEVADAGTSGMDVAFRMRGAGHVVLIDACASGGEPGTLYELPGHEAETPPLQACGNLHAFRWDHAITFARWLLKDQFPRHITVFLIEAENTAAGMELSRPVQDAMHRLIDMLLQRYNTPTGENHDSETRTGENRTGVSRGGDENRGGEDGARENGGIEHRGIGDSACETPSDGLRTQGRASPDPGGPDRAPRVELTAMGSLLLPARLASECFPDAASVLVSARDGELWVMAIGARAVGGLILKQRNSLGDRSILVSEQLPHDDSGRPAWDPGPREATWDREQRALRIPLRLTRASHT